MSKSLKHQFDACSDAIQIAIVDSLRERADYVSSIQRTINGRIPVTGIALELFPWHGGLGLSLRLDSDFPLGQSRYDSADWPQFNFTDGCASPSIPAAIAHVTQIYNQGKLPSHALVDFAHLTFLAGAEALLHPLVAAELNGLGIDAPTLTDIFISSPFQYIVIDADATLKSNYCDIVLANRITKRMLENAA